MSIDFRNPFNSQGTLLTRLRSMLGVSESQTTAGTAPQDTYPVSQADRISLSANAQRLAETLHSDPAPIRNDTDRIAEIRQAIESGTFNIDTSRIADKVRLHYGGR